MLSIFIPGYRDVAADYIYTVLYSLRECEAPPPATSHFAAGRAYDGGKERMTGERADTKPPRNGRSADRRTRALAAAIDLLLKQAGIKFDPYASVSFDMSAVSARETEWVD